MSICENNIKKSILEKIDLEKVKTFQTINIYRSILDCLVILFFYFFNFLTITYFYKFNFYLFLIYIPFGALINGIIFNWMNVQCHEASHNLLLNNRKLNDFFFDFSLGFWCLHDVEGYRATHRNHHSKLHTNEDPDLWFYTEHKNYKNFFTVILKDIFGYSAVKRVFQSLKLKKDNSKKFKNLNNLFFKALYQTLLFIFLFLSTKNIEISILIYLTLQIFPLMCLYPILVRIRTIVQHYHPKLNSKKNELMWISRTTRSNLLGRIIFGGRMDYHFEHHIFPKIPYYKIKILNDMLIEINFFDKKDEEDSFITTSFFTFFYKLIKKQSLEISSNK